MGQRAIRIGTALVAAVLAVVVFSHRFPDNTHLANYLCLFCGAAILAVVGLLFRDIVRHIVVSKSGQERREKSCAVCGYDLRATPDRCPECGTVPT